MSQAQVLLQSIFENLPHPTFLVTPDHRVAFLNQAVEKLAGVPRDQIFRDGCFGLFCDKKKHFEKCPGHVSLYSGKPWDGEVELGGRHYEVSVRPLRIGDTIPYSLVSLSDRTLQFKQHRSLAKLVPRLESLLRHTVGIRDCLAYFATTTDPGALVRRALDTAASVLDATCAYLLRREPDGAFTRVNASFRSPDYDVIPLGSVNTEGLAQFFRDNTESYRDRTEFFYTIGQPKGGSPLWDDILARTRSHRALCCRITVDGKTWGYLGLFVDRTGHVTEEESSLLHDAASLVEIAIRRAHLLHMIEQEKEDLRKAAERAERASHAKSMFLATVSHEIRTPLNAIVGYAELLAAPELHPELHPDALPEYVNGILKASNALLNLINDVLDLAKLESGTSDITTGTCHLPRLFDEMTSLFRWRASQKGIALRPSIAPDFPVLRVSESRMRQILLNLIGNAVKFTDRGEVAWSASATPNADGSVVLALDVRDTGIGIAPDKRETVFDPFVQDISTRGGRIYEGTGLGLPIVKRLVSSCGGTVDLDGVPGGGSLFRVRLPRIEVADDGPAAPVPEAPASEKGHDPASVLLADDVPLNLRILSLHLKAIGFQNIRTASSGNAALAALREQPADLVLTDLWMPDGNGAELARAMRADPALSRIPIVAVTADVNASPLFDTTLFHTILTKPVTTEKLAALLSTLFPKKA